MQTWQLGSLVFFGYVAIVAVLPRGMRPARQASALAGAAFGAGMIGLSRFLSADGIANVWLLPPAALREYIGDGNFGGRYQRSDDEMLALWQVAVEETRALLTF